MKKNFVILVGMSASGKNAVLSELLKTENYKKVITSTSRDMREGEKNGVDYFFYKREDFEKGLKEGKFLEHELIYNNYYGMSLEGINNCKNYKETPITILDPKGAKKAKDLIKDFNIITFFVDEKIENIIQRIAARTNKKDQERTPEAEKDWINHMKYDYIIPSSLTTIQERVDFIKETVESLSNKVKKTNKLKF